ncbi:helix-turn-helix domain-containing protein [Nonomuraea sp. NPDC046802]|uniref:helix-turn-helix domain-containing protein n=1 Tax=Nonomuraea sp. NPDC046802 TaxID=3154919 RepID=UPI0033F3356B
MREFERRFTEFMSPGLPTMASRVLFCLFTSDTGNLTVADLTERLQISPASVSKGVGWLERVGLVRRERDNRRERYLVDDEVWYRAWIVGTQSMALWADIIREGVDTVGRQSPAGVRLKTASRFFDLLSSDMAAAAEHYRRAFYDNGEGP